MGAVLFSVICAIVVFHPMDFSCLKLEVLFMLKLGNIFTCKQLQHTSQIFALVASFCSSIVFFFCFVQFLLNKYIRSLNIRGKEKYTV